MRHHLIVVVGLKYWPSAGVAAPKYSERTKRPIGTWDKEDKDGKETGHTRGAKLVTSAARVIRMAKKTKHKCEERRRSIRSNHLR